MNVTKEKWKNDRLQSEKRLYSVGILPKPSSPRFRACGEFTASEVRVYGLCAMREPRDCEPRRLPRPSGTCWEFQSRTKPWRAERAIDASVDAASEVVR